MKSWSSARFCLTHSPPEPSHCVTPLKRSLQSGKHDVSHMSDLCMRCGFRSVEQIKSADLCGIGSGHATRQRSYIKHK